MVTKRQFKSLGARPGQSWQSTAAQDFLQCGETGSFFEEIFAGCPLGSPVKTRVGVNDAGEEWEHLLS